MLVYTDFSSAAAMGESNQLHQGQGNIIHSQGMKGNIIMQSLQHAGPGSLRWDMFSNQKLHFIDYIFAA